MLADTVREAARRFGDRSAVVGEDGRALSFSDLDRRSDDAARGLLQAGITRGDVVATVLPAVPEHFVLYAAAAKIGAITAAVNTRLTQSEQESVLAVAGAALVVRDAAEIEERPGAELEPLPDDPTHPVVQVFTSGTTGAPKAAVFASRQLAFITDTDVGREWSAGGGNALAGPALAHLGPMTKFPGALRRGLTQHLVREWRAGEVLRRMAELRVASTGGVPTQVALMLRHKDFTKYDFSSHVRAIVIGGGPATPALIREARERFAAPLATRYSCTEAGIGTGTALDGPLEDAEISVGRPQPGVTVRISDEGEVLFSSPAVMCGADEIHTGDLGWIDDEGRLRLEGRLVERYVRGGFNVQPVEVEAILADHPNVAAVAIVGIPDPVMGEIGVAVVVARGEPPSVEDLRRHGGTHLADFKLPDRLVVRDSLPLTSMDKVDRRALRVDLEGKKE